jgi:hypothetical protein
MLPVEGGLLVGQPGAIELLELLGGDATTTLNPCAATVWALASTPSRTLWVACGNELLSLKDDTISQGDPELRARAPIKLLAVTGDGEALRVAFAAEDGTGAIATPNATRRAQKWSGGRSQALAFDATGSALVTASEDGVVLRDGKSAT